MTNGQPQKNCIFYRLQTTHTSIRLTSTKYVPIALTNAQTQVTEFTEVHLGTKSCVLDFEYRKHEISLLKKIGFLYQTHGSNFCITIFVNLELFWHFETVTNIRTCIKSHINWTML